MTRSNQILLSVVALGAAIAAFYFMVLSPKREEVAKLDTQIVAKEAEVEQARLTLAGYEEAKSSYKRNYATLARLGKAVPSDDDVRSMLVQLDAAAKDTGVNFRKIEVGAGSVAGSAPGGTTDATATATGELAPAPGAIQVGAGFSALPFAFAFDGSFFDLSEFFARLERFVTVRNDEIGVTGRLLRLESVQIQPAQAGFPLMEAQINAASYLVPPPEPVGSAAPTGAAGEATQAAAAGGAPSTTTATATGVSP